MVRVPKQKLVELTISSLFLVLFFLFTTKVKQPGLETIRPFYSFGLITTFIISILILLNNPSKLVMLLKLVFGNLFGVILLFILIYMGASAFVVSEFVPGRQIKDQLYFLYWVLVLPLFPFLFVSNKLGFQKIISILAKSTVIFGVTSAILAALMFLDLYSFKFGNVEIMHQYYLRSRIHGTLGEPTSLAQLLGVSLIGLFFLYKAPFESHKITLLILVLAIVATGSRNVLVSLGFIITIYLTTERFKTRKILIAFCYAVVAIIGLVVTGLTTDSLGYFTEQFGNRPTFDLTNEVSRIVIWKTVITMIGNSSGMEILFGHGAFELRREFRAGFNTPLEMAYDYGLVVFSLFVFIIFYSVYQSIKKHETSGLDLFRYSRNLTFFGLLFCQFMSYFPTMMFQFAVFSFLLGGWISVVPLKWLQAEMVSVK